MDLPILETERLSIRRFTLEDAAFILALVNDPEWLRHIGDRKVHSLEDARGYLANRVLASYERHGFGMWAVCLRETGEPIGTCGLIRREGLTDVDIGFAFLPGHRGKGYALESARSVLDHGIRALGMKRILAIVSPANDSSIRLLEQLGMKLERMIRLPDDAEEIRLYAYDAM
ncbi:MAG TPA: GNAT family N-acetyltransferase [Candidatus Polarisedimenticolia bacterium]|nr:GNAT family N-acetyltransferase [Candidatus Polarisedimenticolia bacterium]